MMTMIQEMKAREAAAKKEGEWTMLKINIARVRNCPDVAISNSLFGPCLLPFCLFVFLSFGLFCNFVFLSFRRFVCLYFCLFV